MPLTNFPNGISSFGIPVLGGASKPFTGKYFFVDPVSGSDGNTGLAPKKAFSTLYKAHAMCTAGQNDVVFLMSDGASTSTARLSKAIAQSVDSTATTGVLTWSKNATHLVGICSSGSNKRARIAPPTGTYTMATFGSGNFVVVTAAGCTFANVSVFHGFSTGGASQIAWTDSGGRNEYVNMDFFGMGDAESAATATGRSLLVTGSTGENNFTNCTIGLDTTARSSGSFEFELAAGSPRNHFERCVIQTNAGAVGCFWLKVGASGIDRYVLFRDCAFINPVASGASSMTTGISANASPGGAILMQNCLSYGAAKIDTAQKTFTNIANSASLGGAVTATSA